MINPFLTSFTLKRTQSTLATIGFRGRESVSEAPNELSDASVIVDTHSDQYIGNDGVGDDSQTQFSPTYDDGRPKPPILANYLYKVSN